MPERALRFTAAGLGGFIYEATQLLLPDWLRRTRLYDAIVAGLLRIAIELVGGATGILPPENMDAQELLARKAAGTGIELAGLLTIGWSPLWIFALTADVTGGTHTYLRELVSELRQDGLLAEDADIDSVEELLDTLENTSGLAADTLDTPPLNIGDLRQTWHFMQRHATGYPDAGGLTSIYGDMYQVVKQEGCSLRSLSGSIGSAAARAGVKTGQRSENDRPARQTGPTSSVLHSSVIRLRERPLFERSFVVDQTPSSDRCTISGDHLRWCQHWRLQEIRS